MRKLVSIGIMDNFTSEFSLHQHDIWEACYYISGKGTVFIGNQEISFEAGDLVFIPPKTDHHEIASEPYKNIFLLLEDYHLPIYPALKVSDTDSRSIYMLITLLHKEFHIHRVNYSSLSENLLSTIEQYIIAQLSVSENDKFADRCKEIILDNLSDSSFTLERFFTEFNYHPDYVRRIFKKSTGMSIISYLQQKRIEYAAHLMQTNEYRSLTVKQISSLSGFHDPYYFSKTFKGITGLSPAAYLKQLNKR